MPAQSAHLRQSPLLQRTAADTSYGGPCRHPRVSSETLYEEALLTSDQLLALGSPETVLVTAGNFPDRERMRPAFAAILRQEDTADFPALARLALALPPVTDGVIRPNYLQASAAEEKRRAGEAPR